MSGVNCSVVSIVWERNLWNICGTRLNLFFLKLFWLGKFKSSEKSGQCISGQEPFIGLQKFYRIVMYSFFLSSSSSSFWELYSQVFIIIVQFRGFLSQEPRPHQRHITCKQSLVSLIKLNELIRQWKTLERSWLRFSRLCLFWVEGLPESFKMKHDESWCFQVCFSPLTQPDY